MTEITCPTHRAYMASIDSHSYSVNSRAMRARAHCINSSNRIQWTFVSFAFRIRFSLISLLLWWSQSSAFATFRCDYVWEASWITLPMPSNDPQEESRLQRWPMFQILACLLYCSPANPNRLSVTPNSDWKEGKREMHKSNLWNRAYCIHTAQRWTLLFCTCATPNLESHAHRNTHVLYLDLIN